MSDAGELAGEGRGREAQQVAELAHQMRLIGEAVRRRELGPSRRFRARGFERGESAATQTPDARQLLRREADRGGEAAAKLAR